LEARLKMRIYIHGKDSLAAATRQCCERHFIVLREKSDADLHWFCDDTPIGKDDRPDSDWVLAQIRANLPPLGSDTLVLVSSQMPVGTTAQLEHEFPSYVFAYSPENIRVASAVADFENQARIVVGRRTERHDFILSQLFAPFTKNLIFTDPETAECCKHFLNTFLALQIAFINEAARVCGKVGADVNVVSLALLTERRVSPKAPLRPGAPYGGGHLARDIYVLGEVAALAKVEVPIIAHIKESNEAHTVLPKPIAQVMEGPRP
jgi:UDPglucose 6-dehydrogenase